MIKFFNYIFLFSVVISQSQVGTSAANFLGIGVGSRAVSMGGAYTSNCDDPSIIYWNPGAIAKFDGDRFQISNVSWLVDTELFFSTYIKKINDRSMGVYWTYLNYGEEEITDLDNQDGTKLYWSASDLVIGLIYSMNLTERFAFGGGLKYISQNIYNESSSALAIDMGLLYTSKNNKYNIGMSISNVGFDMKLDGKDLYQPIDLDPNSEGNNETIIANLNTDSFPLPLIYRMGFSFEESLTKNVKLLSSFDFVIPSDDVETLNLGFELSYYDRVFFRSGYSDLGNKDSIKGLTLGIGTKLYLLGMDFDLNYAYQNFEAFGFVPHVDFIFNL
mgnify:FL=1